MKKVILDTSFILSAVRQRIDFFSWLEEEGFIILIPNGVIRELEGLGARLALKILKKNKFESIKIDGKDVDNTIIEFAKKHKSIVVATLDAGMKKKIKNPKLVIRQKKKLEII
jgi:rRNA-processing protein FCF1